MAIPWLPFETMLKKMGHDMSDYLQKKTSSFEILLQHLFSVVHIRVISAHKSNLVQPRGAPSQNFHGCLRKLATNWSVVHRCLHCLNLSCDIGSFCCCCLRNTKNKCKISVRHLYTPTTLHPYWPNAYGPQDFFKVMWHAPTSCCNLHAVIFLGRIR